MSDAPPDLFEELHRLFTPERLLRDPRATGEGVRVCILDSGVDRARLYERAAARGQEVYPVEGALFRDASPEPVPDQGQPSSPHGTTVADILLTIAPRIRLFSADVFGPMGSSDVRVLIRAVRHAMDVWRCQVLNLSLGIAEPRLIPARKVELQRVIEEAYHRDVLVVAAAHNEHPLTRSYPALFAPPLLSSDKGRFSDPLEFAYEPRGQVEFKAHGQGYFGPFANDLATSWAAPHLTGIVARILSLRPGLKPFEMKTILYWLAKAASRPGLPSAGPG